MRARAPTHTHIQVQTEELSELREELAALEEAQAHDIQAAEREMMRMEAVRDEKDAMLQQANKDANKATQLSRAETVNTRRQLEWDLVCVCVCTTRFTLTFSFREMRIHHGHGTTLAGINLYILHRS